MPLRIIDSDKKVVIDLTTSPELPKSHAPVHSHTPATLKTSGKIRSKQHTHHYSSRRDSTDNFNSMDIPPPIPLILPASGAKVNFDVIPTVSKISDTCTFSKVSPLYWLVYLFYLLR